MSRTRVINGGKNSLAPRERHGTLSVPNVSARKFISVSYADFICVSRRENVGKTVRRDRAFPCVGAEKLWQSSDAPQLFLI